jgi:hypothetical protein
MVTRGVLHHSVERHFLPDDGQILCLGCTMNMRSKGSFIADAVAYLATADFVTDQVLLVDGDRSLVWQDLMGLCFSETVEVLSIKPVHCSHQIV